MTATGPEPVGITTATPTSGPRADVSAVARSTVAMTALTALSRLTGLVRVLVVAAVLGTTFLGNTYQSANTVPNLLFELFAAGVLQAVLIPSLVELFDRGDQREAEHVVGSVLGLACAGLAVLAAIGMLTAPWLMRALVSGVDDPTVRDEQVRLGTVFLWFFLPQVVLYAAGMVATGVLNARNRFALPAFAPVVNNVVVTSAYGVFWLLRDGAEPSLDLRPVETAVLAGGTTLAVLAFCAVPVVGLVRSGFSLRPRLDHRHPVVRRLARLGVWAALYLAMTQVVLAAVLVLANTVEGGVVAYQVAFTFFLLPHALFALPVLTALFPRLSRQAIAADWASFGRSVASGMRAISYFVLAATAALVALAAPLSRPLLFGASSGTGAEQVAGAIAGFAPGLIGYGGALFLARCFYALGDTRTPALVNAGVAAVAVALMVVAAAGTSDDDRIALLAAAHSAAHLAGAGALLVLLRRRLPGAVVDVGRPLTAGLVAAAAAVAVMVAVQHPLDLGGRVGDLATVVAAGVPGAAVYLAVQATLGRTSPLSLLAVVRGGGGA